MGVATRGTALSGVIILFEAAERRDCLAVVRVVACSALDKSL